jgi:hypothetical protein
VSVYYIKTKKADWPNVINLGTILGVLYPTEDGKGIGPGWIYGGEFRDGEIIDIENLPPFICDESGIPYIHANLVMEGSLRALAEAKAVEFPALAEALSEIPRYFLTDEFGQPRAPANPRIVVPGLD